jgi:hypothetical protein
VAVPVLTGWRRSFTADGVILSVPEGAGHGIIRIRPLIAPLRTLRTILADYLTRPREGAPVPEVEGPFGMTTSEGEYGAVVNEIAVRDQRVVQRTLALIYGDLTLASIEGTTREPAAFDLFRQTVERLAKGHALGLGVERWRRYFYDAPRGWSGVASSRAVVWIPPDFPRARHAILRVHEARPSRTTAATLQYRRLFEQLPREFGATRPAPPVMFTTEQGLRGELVTYTGPEAATGRMIKVSDATLADDRYVYFLRFESDDAHFDAHQEIFATVLQSVRPLPVPSLDVDVLIHWSD